MSSCHLEEWDNGTKSSISSHPMKWSVPLYNIESDNYFQIIKRGQHLASCASSWKLLRLACDWHYIATEVNYFSSANNSFTIHLEGKYGVIPWNISACKSRRVIEATADDTNQFGDVLFLASLYCPHHNHLTQLFWSTIINVRQWGLSELRKRWNELYTQSISTLICYILTLLIPGNV